MLSCNKSHMKLIYRHILNLCNIFVQLILSMVLNTSSVIFMRSVFDLQIYWLKREQMLMLHTNRLHNLHTELSRPQWSAVGLFPAAEGDAVLCICLTAALWWRLTHICFRIFSLNPTTTSQEISTCFLNKSNKELLYWVTVEDISCMLLCLTHVNCFDLWCF